MIAAVGVAALGVGLVGCSAPSNTSPSSSSGSSGPSLILVTPTPVGSNPFLQLAVDGIKKAAKTAGGSSRVFQAQDNSQIISQLEAAIAAKPKVIVAEGFEFADALAADAPKNPEQQFLFIDSCTTKQLPNVACATFREYEAVYLAGVEAGMVTKTNKVGGVASLDTPQIRRYSDPFGAGAKAVNSKVTFTPLFIGGSDPFNDPTTAKQEALTLANGGDDVIMAASAGGNQAIFNVAKSAGFLAVGTDTNQCPLAPGVVLDNVLKKVDVVIEARVQGILNGKFGGSETYGVAQKAMSVEALEPGVASSQCVIAKYPDVIAKVKAVAAEIISRKTVVKDPETATK